METIYFEDYEEMACAILDKLDEITCEDDFNDISIVAKYKEAIQLIKELLSIGCDIKSVDIHDVELDWYVGEYLVSVTKTDDEYEVWCEPMYRESGYLYDDSKVIYILDNCSSKVIPYCDGETVYDVSVGEESGYCDCDDCECDCEHDYMIDGKRVDVDNYNDYVSKFAPDMKVKTDDKASTTSKVEYKINGRITTKEEYEKALNNIEDMYLDNIRDMLLRYSDFMDDYNDLLRMFY